jgi:hypothetical protein
MGVKGSYLPCINLTGYSTGNGPEMECVPVSCHEIPASCRMCTVNNGSADISSPQLQKSLLVGNETAGVDRYVVCIPEVRLSSTAADHVRC